MVNNQVAPFLIKPTRRAAGRFPVRVSHFGLTNMLNATGHKLRLPGHAKVDMPTVKRASDNT